MDFSEVKELIYDLDARISFGINWYFATGFKTKEVAQEFVDQLNKAGIEKQGVNNTPSVLTFSVSWRL